MAKVTYVDAGGLATTIDVAEGWSLMQAAVTNGVQGIVGECGGSCACATCHCYVDEARLAELPGPDDNELAMLDFAAADVRANSRLSCQIKASSRLLKKSDSGAKFVNKPDSKRVPPGIKIEPKCVFQQPARATLQLTTDNASCFATESLPNGLSLSKRRVPEISRILIGDGVAPIRIVLQVAVIPLL